MFLLDGGETSGEDRLPFLEKGILEILSNATGGLSIVIEHRWAHVCLRLLSDSSCAGTTVTLCRSSPYLPTTFVSSTTKKRSRTRPMYVLTFSKVENQTS